MALDPSHRVSADLMIARRYLGEWDNSRWNTSSKSGMINTRFPLEINKTYYTDKSSELNSGICGASRTITIRELVPEE